MAPGQTVLYLRESVDDEQGISRHRKDCRALCDRRGWTVAREYVDNDRSASSGLRPDYQRMLTDVRAGRIHRIVAWDLDRLYRQPRELEDLIDLADAKRIDLATVTGEVDLSTDNGRLYARIKGAVARGEVERKSARQKLAASQRADSGLPWWPSRPFGYDADPDPQTGKWWTVRRDPRTNQIVAVNPIRLHPTEAALLRAAYTAVFSGTALHTIAAQWNAQGVKTPKDSQWRGAQVRQLLLSGRNAGLREYRGEVVGEGGKWPAIVDETTWRGVCALLNDPARRKGATRGRVHLLSGIARCGAGDCGQPLGSGIASTTNQPNYMCKMCFGVSRNAAKVDAMVVEAVVSRLSREDAVELTTNHELPDTDALRDQRRALNERLKALGNDYGTGKPQAFIDAAVASIQAQLDAINGQLTDVGKAHIFDGLRLGTAQVDEDFDRLDLDRRRAVITALLTVNVNPTGRGRTFDRDAVNIVFHQQATGAQP